MVIKQAFDLPLTLEMGQAFRWTMVQETEGDSGNRKMFRIPNRGTGTAGYSGVMVNTW